MKKETARLVTRRGQPKGIQAVVPAQESAAHAMETFQYCRSNRNYNRIPYICSWILSTAIYHWVLAWKSPCFAEYIPTWMILCSINCRIKDQIQSHSARFFTAFLSSPRRLWRKKRVRRSPSLFLPGHRTAGRCPNWRTSAPARRPGQGLDEAMVYSWFS